MALNLTPTEIRSFDVAGAKVDLVALIDVATPATLPNHTPAGPDELTIGQVVYAWGMGKFRRGVVIKIGRTRAVVAFTTRGAVDEATRYGLKIRVSNTPVPLVDIRFDQKPEPAPVVEVEPAVEGPDLANCTACIEDRCPTHTGEASAPVEPANTTPDLYAGPALRDLRPSGYGGPVGGDPVTSEPAPTDRETSLTPAARRDLASLRQGLPVDLRYGPYLQLVERGLITGPQDALVLVKTPSTELAPCTKGRGKFDAAWAVYFANHPEVLATYGHQNGRWPSCGGGECGCPVTEQAPANVVVGG